MSNPTRIAIIGCGAIVQGSHAPVLAKLAAAKRVQVTVCVDPASRQREELLRRFPGATGQMSASDLSCSDLDLALIASPARFHAKQTIDLLESGCPVFCEKPLATNTADAEVMVATARRTGCMLAAGQFRRFFPALQELKTLIEQRTYGRLQSFLVHEGGAFNWPAATPSFFDPDQAGGGVLLDLGIHVLDTLHQWLGNATSVNYFDDAVGGLEANCLLRLKYEDGLEGEVFLSRDSETRNRWELKFEHAHVVWRAGQADRLETRVRGSSQWQNAQFEIESERGRVPADSYDRVFSTQLDDVLNAVVEGRPPRITGESALPALRQIEHCYANREALELPWLSSTEQTALHRNAVPRES